MTKLKVGLGQINPTVGDFEANTAKICDYIDTSERLGLHLVIFPELSISGYPVWDLATNVSFVAANLKALAKIRAFTRSKAVTVILGFIDKGTDRTNRSHNALVVLRGGKIIQKQHKTLLPTYDVFLEQIFFSPAAKVQPPFNFNGIRIGTSICEDIWDDQYVIQPARLLARKGARILINISASPYHRKIEQVRNKIICKKAKQYGLWMIYVNQVGGQDDLIFDGRSVICDPKGRIRFQADAFHEGLYSVHLDLAGHASKASETKDEINEIYQALCLGLRDYVTKNRFKKVVIGLSGGIDSALVAALATDALGPEAVIGVGMPGPYSSAKSLEDARALAKLLGIEFRVMPIKSQYRHFLQGIRTSKHHRRVHYIEGERITLAMENLQARLRGLELMYLSNDEGALLLTTGNKSELAMGYATLYGDMCGGLSVIGDVYKTDVYRLARYRNQLTQVIPARTINRAPSAELRPHQKDQDSLPPYEVLDQILYHYVERNESVQEIYRLLKSKGANLEMIHRVVSSVDHNEYKRRQLPPSLRITQKAWFGRRMPITNAFNRKCS